MSMAKTVTLIILGVAAAGGVGYLTYEYIQTRKERDTLKKQLDEIDELFQPIMPEPLSKAKLDGKAQQMAFLLRTGVHMGLRDMGVNVERITAFLEEHQAAVALLGEKLAERTDVTVTLANLQDLTLELFETMKDNEQVTKFEAGIQTLVQTKDLPSEAAMTQAANDAVPADAVTA